MKKRFEEVEGVELDEEETNLALLVAKETKLRQKINREYAEKIRNGITWEIPNARELFENLRRTKSRTGKWYKVTEFNSDVIAILCLYFSGSAEDKKILSDKYPHINLDKSICLTGSQGVGKTHLMNFRTAPEGYGCRGISVAHTNSANCSVNLPSRWLRSKQFARILSCSARCFSWCIASSKSASVVIR